MAAKKQIKSKRVRRGDGPDALAVAAQLREVNADQHRTINEKLDTIKAAIEKLVESSTSQGKELVVQNGILKDHMRRTELLETQVTALEAFRNKVMAISAFVMAFSAIVIAVFKIWF